MPQKRNKLEAQYEPGRSYLVPGGLLNELIRSIQRNRPIPGRNMEGKETPDGVVINGKSGTFEPPAFQITMIPKGGSNWTLEVGKGILRRLDTGTTVTVTGTDTERAVSANQFVWIDVTINAGAPTAAAIGSGNAWPGSPALAQYSGVNQTRAICILAYITQNDDNSQILEVRGGAPGNRLLVQGFLNGRWSWAVVGG